MSAPGPSSPQPNSNPPPVSSELAARVNAYCVASDLRQRYAALIRLTRWLRPAESDQKSDRTLESLVGYLEANPDVSLRFQASTAALLKELNSLSLFAEAGIPSDASFPAEIAQRLAARLLPSAREESDTSKLLVTLYSSKREVDHFLAIPPELFRRMSAEFAATDDGAVWQSQRRDLCEAMRLLAARISGIGVQPEVRDRSTTTAVSDSPFYRLVGATEDLLRDAGTENALAAFVAWKAVVRLCRQGMSEVHRHMESAGVSVELIFDLKKIEACLLRMEAIARVLVATSESNQVTAVQALLAQVILGRLSDRSLRALLRENLNLIARKMVERTGHSGEHYIAHSRAEYWHMWRAALGGGLFTVITAAIKMRIVDAQLPMFVEGFLSGTNYAVSFVLLQVFGLVLATKQPAATAATFAGIIRNNQGDRRSTKLSEFVAHITSTQLAAAIGNVIAVTVGAVAFERLWRVMFSESYLSEHSAEHIYETLHLFGSGTAFFAIVTGIILWMAALAGGWFENLAVYYRFSEAVAQHPMGSRIGESAMEKVARVLSRNLGGWSTSIVLGYLLGFTPVLGHFFGIPLDVRHVTLSTGTLALAAARYGFVSLGRTWFYHAVAGIAVIFVLNLGVSFTISAYVALRAYNVRPSEQWRILRSVMKNALRAPLPFIVPRYDTKIPEEEIEEGEVEELQGT
jgi:site-specific recombinase